MEHIEFNVDVKFGDSVIDKISVKPLTFVEFAQIWRRVEGAPKPEAALQRNRILHQTHFMSGGKRVIPDAAEIGQLNLHVAKDIIASLDVGQGEIGKIINDGDGTTSPILYQLGTPIKLKEKGEIKELEFQASTYAEVEDILATHNEIMKADVLIRTLAAPVGVPGLMRLPSWAVDSLTMADGVGIMNTVNPVF